MKWNNYAYLFKVNEKKTGVFTVNSEQSQHLNHLMILISNLKIKVSTNKYIVASSSKRFQ